MADGLKVWEDVTCAFLPCENASKLDIFFPHDMVREHFNCNGPMSK